MDDTEMNIARTLNIPSKMSSRGGEASGSGVRTSGGGGSGLSVSCWSSLKDVRSVVTSVAGKVLSWLLERR